jgi:nicotinamide riboside transporter PnuC
MWSYVLAIIGVTGIFFVGRKTIWGWLILLTNECIWVAYALATKQYGFILMATAYSAVYIKSYMLWRKEDNAPKRRYENPSTVSQYEMNTHGSIDHRFIRID